MNKLTRVLILLILAAVLSLFAFSLAEGGATVSGERENPAFDASTTATYKPISLGVPFGGTVGNEPDDLYKIYVTESARYIFTLSNESKYMRVIVYDAAGNRVGYCGHYKHNNPDGNWTVDLDGGQTYYVHVDVDPNYNSGTSYYRFVVNTYIKGSLTSRAKALPYGEAKNFTVKYANDFQVFGFTAAKGTSYRVTATGNIYKKVTVLDSSLNIVKTGMDSVYGTSSFDVTLTPGRNYYIKVEGMSGIWYKIGSGTIMIECLDSNVALLTYTVDKTTVNPGFNDHVRFDVTTAYASKVRLVVDESWYSPEYAIKNGKTAFNVSFHQSGRHYVYVQGYYNGGWTISSKTTVITVTSKTKLAAPIIINDDDQSPAGKNFTVYWKAVTGAVRYRVYLYQNGVLLAYGETANTWYTFSGSLLKTPGVYNIEVIALGNDNEQSPKGTGRLTVIPVNDDDGPIGGINIIALKPAYATGYIAQELYAYYGVNQNYVSVAFSPANAKPAKVEWKSSNKKILKIYDYGYENGLNTVYFKMLKTGKAKISVTVTDVNGKKLTASCTIKVKKTNAKIKSLHTDYSTVYLNVGDEVRGKALITYKPWNAYYNQFAISSSNKKVIRIQNNGCLYARKRGNAVVTFRTTKGGLVLKINVVVK